MTSRYVPVRKEDTYTLIKKAQQGDKNACELIIEQNTGLVKNLALKYTGTGYEMEDLLQVGFIGLLKAIERFDTGFDVMFSTYAVPMILGEIKRYIRDDGNIKVSRQLKTDMRHLRMIREDYYNRTGKAPKISYLAEQLGVSTERVLEILDASDRLSSIESFDNDEFMKDYREKKVNRESEEDRNVDLIDLKNSIGELEEKERKIIVLRYFRDMTQQQVADMLGISQVQVSRIEKRVLREMKEKMI